MKILSISAQKPNSTGSGVYMTELIRAFGFLGHEQAVIAGINPDDEISFPAKVSFSPVSFKSERIPFPVVGMSDVMPYESTRYRDMTPQMAGAFKAEFDRVIRNVIEEFGPELIVCHHLYLTTAIASFAAKDYGIPIVGVCHSTCLRQYKSHGLEREMILEGIRGLSCIYALHRAQAEQIVSVYDVPEVRVEIIGAGYNQEIFNNKDKGFRHTDPSGAFRFGFAGKVTRDKGVISMLRALDRMKKPKEGIELFIAGGSSDPAEYDKIVKMAKGLSFPVHFMGKLPQEELAKLWNKCDIFLLTSFYEGLPLTLIEAMACGLKAVASDWPGVKEWILENAPDADIKFVPLPDMGPDYIPDEKSLRGFEENISFAVEEQIGSALGGFLQADMSSMSWNRIAERMIRLAF